MVVMLLEGDHKVGHHLWMQQGYERVLGPESIPESEDSGVVRAVAPVHLDVAAAEPSVHVRIELRVEEGVVESSVEYSFLLAVRVLYLND